MLLKQILQSVHHSAKNRGGRIVTIEGSDFLTSGILDSAIGLRTRWARSCSCDCHTSGIVATHIASRCFATSGGLLSGELHTLLCY